MTTCSIPPCRCLKCLPLRFEEIMLLMHTNASDKDLRGAVPHRDLPGLCEFKTPVHMESADHVENVRVFLERRGLQDAARPISVYGVAAAYAVALDIDQAEREGRDWASEAMKGPGPMLYSLIRAWANKMVAPKSRATNHVDDYRAIKGALPWSE